jgi:hypothetical protein
VTLPLLEELAELRAEVAQKRRELQRSERAESEGRVVDRDGWRAALARRHAALAALEQEEARLVARLDAVNAEEAQEWSGTGGS